MRVELDPRVGVTAFSGADSPYVLVAVAPSVHEIATAAGGLLCDKAISGWRVDVAVDGGPDEAALTILGVQNRAGTGIDRGFTV
jgi:hypothetical protein